jgi:TatA/E family protein of Tat protein translocase
MLSIPHLIVIFAVALVVFGPEKLPELARNLGKVMAEFRKVTGDFRSTFEGHLRDLERETTERKIGGGAAPGTGTAILPAQPAAPQADSGLIAESGGPAVLPPAPGAVTADEPYLSRSATPATSPSSDHAREDDAKIDPSKHPESISDNVSDDGKRPG